MDEKAIISLQQELSKVEGRISALNDCIREVVWRQSPAGNRRESSRDHNDPAANGGGERRLSSADRLAQLRRELAGAFQRYQDLYTLLRTLRDTPPCDEAS